MHSTEIEAAARAWLRDNVVPGVSDAGRNALMLAYCAGALMKLDKMGGQHMLLERMRWMRAAGKLKRRWK